MGRDYSAAGAAARARAPAPAAAAVMRGVVRCGLRGFDRDDDGVGGRDQREAGGQLHVAGGDVVADVERGDVDLELLRQLAGRALDVDRVRDDVHDAAAVFHARRNADRVNGDRCGDRFGLRDALEIGRDRTMRDRVALHFAQQHRFFFAVDRRVDDVAPPPVEISSESAFTSTEIACDAAVAVEGAGDFALRGARAWRRSYRCRCGFRWSPK